MVTQDGLPGCGLTIAHQLARGNLPETLFTAATQLSPHGLQEFLFGWRDELENELLNDPNGLMGTKRPALARNLPLDFPRVSILWLYTHPLTSWSGNGHGPDTTSWTLRQPNLAQLAVRCEKSFSWGSIGTIIDRFRENVWPAALMRMLLKVMSSF